MADIWIDVDAAVTVPVNIAPLIDDTDFKSREVALTYNQAGMDLVWNFITCAGVITQTAVTPTTAGVYDWTHVGDGMYKIEIPASGGVSINNDTEGFGWFTGFCTGVLPWRGPIIGFRAAGLNDKLIETAYSTTRGLVGTALPDAAADAAGGLPISDAGGLDLDAKLANTNEVTAGRLSELDAGTPGKMAAEVDLIKTDAAAILVDTGTTLDGRIPAALTANGNMKCSLMEILTTALTETAGLLAGGFKKFFNMAVPTGTVNSIPDAVAGAAGGIAIVGSEMAADVTKVNGVAQTATLDTIKAVVDTIQADTDLLDDAVGGIVDIHTDVAAVKAETAELKAAVITNAAGVDIAADIIAVKADTAAILADTGTEGVVVASGSKTGYALSAAGVDAILDDAPATELAAVPSTTGTFRQMVQYVFQYLRNRRSFNKTTGVETLYKEDALTSLGTSTSTDDGTTFDKGEVG